MLVNVYSYYWIVKVCLAVVCMEGGSSQIQSHMLDIWTLIMYIKNTHTHTYTHRHTHTHTSAVIIYSYIATCVYLNRSIANTLDYAHIIR